MRSSPWRQHTGLLLKKNIYTSHSANHFFNSYALKGEYAVIAIHRKQITLHECRYRLMYVSLCDCDFDTSVNICRPKIYAATCSKLPVTTHTFPHVGISACSLLFQEFVICLSEICELCQSSGISEEHSSEDTVDGWGRGTRCITCKSLRINQSNNSYAL